MKSTSKTGDLLVKSDSLNSFFRILNVGSFANGFFAKNFLSVGDYSLECSLS